VEAESRSYAAGSATTLLQIGLGAPDGRVVGHVVVGCKQLHLCSDTHTHSVIVSLTRIHANTMKSVLQVIKHDTPLRHKTGHFQAPETKNIILDSGVLLKMEVGIRKGAWQRA